MVRTHIINIRYAIAALLLSLICHGAAKAQQVGKDELNHAISTLKGAMPGESKEEALAIVRTSAERDSNANAMNAIGMAYMYGLGVKTDTATAINWLQRAGEKGYTQAFHNLGLMYKDGIGVRQNFAKAYQSFMSGVGARSVMCHYDAGFMLYKGLGCSQSYTAAADLFQYGADRDYSPSLYMLGLCYRNGYGVEQDTAKARFYLERAGKLGYRMALEELNRRLPENYLHELAASVDSLSNLPQSMPDVNSSVNDTSMIAGRYAGVLVLYDWSGNYILGEKPVRMDIKSKNGKFVGELLVEGKPVGFESKVMPDGSLAFDKGQLLLGDRYLDSHSVRYRMDYARLDVWENSLAGQLGLYSLALKEPERPMYIQLQREGTSALDSLGGETASREKGGISVSPNPFDTNLTAIFELQENVSNAEARIFNKSAMLVDRIAIGSLEKGRHSVSLSPNVRNGEYVLNIKAGKEVLRTIIIKKGGEK